MLGVRVTDLVGHPPIGHRARRCTHMQRVCMSHPVVHIPVFSSATFGTLHPGTNCSGMLVCRLDEYFHSNQMMGEGAKWEDLTE